MKSMDLYTKDQYLGFLVDDALFSDSPSARVRAINQLAREYGPISVPIIEDIVKTLPVTDDIFRAFCVNVIIKTKDQRNCEE